MVKASALPLAQPGRLTTSCTKAARSGVRWSLPAAPIVAQAGGDQETEAPVRGSFSPSAYSERMATGGSIAVPPPAALTVIVTSSLAVSAPSLAVSLSTEGPAAGKRACLSTAEGSGKGRGP